MEIRDAYDVAVIGGGPAGITAALSARKHYPQSSVLLIDRSIEIGRKFMASGAGRGNLTNVNLKNNPERYFYGDRDFVASVFSRFGYDRIIGFFRDLGVPTYEEKKTDRGKVFAVVDNAKTVRDILSDALFESGVEVQCGTDVLSLNRGSGGWNIETSEGSVRAGNVVLTTGGKTYPAFGADGSGYDLAASVGHRITPPVVTAVPVVSRNMLSHFLQGEKLEMEAVCLIGGKDRMKSVGDVMFTQYGFSGPAIFDVSHDISIRLNRDMIHDVEIRLSFFPGKDKEEVKEMLRQRFGKHAHLPVAHSLWGLFTEKTAGGICAVARLPKDRTASELADGEFDRLVETVTAFTTEVSETRGWNEGEFTAGGVDTDEVEHTTLRSRKAGNLYVAGEMLDVDGQVGGFNLSWAWATGWIAGKSAAGGE